MFLNKRPCKFINSLKRYDMNDKQSFNSLKCLSVCCCSIKKISAFLIQSDDFTFISVFCLIIIAALLKCLV